MSNYPYYLRNVQETYLANKDAIPADEAIWVAPPHPLAPSEALLANAARWEQKYLRERENPTNADLVQARKYAWQQIGYEALYRREIAVSPPAQAELLRILANANAGKKIVLYCRTKEKPCHRFILLNILREMAR